MANYYGKGRSNYFKVKEPDAFVKALEEFPDLEYHRDNEGRFMIMDSNPNGGGWPTSLYNEKSDDYIDLDLPGVIAKHLDDDAVAVLMEVGSEKYRFLLGWAVAINNKGERETINISDIYEKSEKPGNKHYGSGLLIGESYGYGFFYV